MRQDDKLMKKILIIASNPRKDLNLDREIRDLKGVIQRSRNKAQFEVEIELAVRPGALQELFLANEPRIVHFCGHGTGEQGLVLENDAGREQLVSTNALSSLFELFDDKVECVLLNACYSEVQANAIIEHINYVVGMSQEIGDDAAIAFATGFYQGLGYGKSIEQSYRLGCNAIQLQIDNNATVRSRSPEASRKLGAVDAVEQVFIPEHLKPKLKKKQHLTPFVELDSSTQPDIPPEIIEALKEEVARKRYREQAREAWDDFGRVPGSRVQPLTQEEYRRRQVLLSKVKDSWIKGVLENSLHTNALIKLKLEERPNAVLRSFSDMEELPAEPDESFERLQATDIFEQMGAGRTLLILGEPGSGKTIALLKLAQRLVARTEQDLSQPIPVVFNLSSWASKRQTIDEWLVEELKLNYQISRALGKTWVEQEQLILLLDGLDEVQAEHRDACVRVLNQFIEAHGTTEIVVCSRVRDYESLSERLNLRSAIYIQLLTSEQVYQYLDEAGDQLVGLKTLLQHDAKLEEFARTPLILSVMSLAYEGCSSTDLLNQVGLTENRYQRLFDNYLERMLKRRITTQQYSPKQTKLWLNWLAQQLDRESITEFRIEGIQPVWLTNKTLKKAYRVRLGIISGFIFALCSALIFGTSSGVFLSDILYSIGKLNSSLLGGLLGLIAGFAVGFLSGYNFILPNGIWLQHNLPKRQLVQAKKQFAQERMEKIRLAESLNWSWKRARYAFLWCLGLGVAYGEVGSLFFYFIEPDIDKKLGIFLLKGLIGGLIGGLVFGLYTGLLLGITGLEKIEKRNVPNQGIWKSAINAVIVGSISGLGIGLILSLLVWLCCDLMQLITIFNTFSGVPLVSGLSIGLPTALMLGLQSGGAAIIKHFALRMTLYNNGYIPWNYAHFLDYAADHLFMQKVGGGYIFVHRMLMEHFAQMKLD